MDETADNYNSTASCTYYSSNTLVRSSTTISGVAYSSLTVRQRTTIEAAIQQQTGASHLDATYSAEERRRLHRRLATGDTVVAWVAGFETTSVASSFKDSDVAAFELGPNPQIPHHTNTILRAAHLHWWVAIV